MTESFKETQNKSFLKSEAYQSVLNELKNKVYGNRLSALRAVNLELVNLYWHIGKQIRDNQTWGDKFVEVLSRDLQHTFPETQGFSIRNLQRMYQFALYYEDLTSVPQAVAQLSWAHIAVLIYKVKDETIRCWYAEQAIEQGWSHLTLKHRIKTNLYQRKGSSSAKASNYLAELSLPQSRFAQELFKQPYPFDFLGLHAEAYQREVENVLIEPLTRFMLGLGKGFAFVGSHVPITIEDEQYFIDMLFYNLHLRSFTVFEIKATKLKREHKHQLSTYLTAVDNLMKHKDDKPSIGILLCKSREDVLAKYVLKNIKKSVGDSIGLSEYELTRVIPERLEADLPTVEEIEASLNDIGEFPAPGML